VKGSGGKSIIKELLKIPSWLILRMRGFFIEEGLLVFGGGFLVFEEGFLVFGGGVFSFGGGFFRFLRRVF